MDSTVVRVARKLAARAVVTVDTAVMASTGAVVGADGEPVELPVVCWPRPRPGMRVLVLRAGPMAWVIGSQDVPATPSASGIVTAVSGSQVTVTVDGTARVLPSTVAGVQIGQRAVILWQVNPDGTASGWVVGATAGTVGPGSMETTTPTPTHDTGSATGTTTQRLVTTTILASDAGTWRAGWRTDTTEVVQGGTAATNTGYVFYGGRLASALSGDVQRVELRVAASTGFSGARQPRLSVHDAQQRTASKPTTYDEVALAAIAPGRVARYDITSRLAALRAHPGLALTGIGGGDWARFKSLGTDPENFALYITRME